MKLIQLLTHLPITLVLVTTIVLTPRLGRGVGVQIFDRCKKKVVKKLSKICFQIEFYRKYSKSFESFMFKTCLVMMKKIHLGFFSPP